jgi:hypothetical protein
MANKLYPTGKQKLLEGGIAWLTDTIHIVALDATYTYNAAHEFHDDLTGLVGSAVALGTKTSTLGVADAADATFVAISGAQVTQLVILKWTGVSGTSALIAHLDSATGLPFTPSGADETVAFDGGASKIFAI